MPEGCAFFLEAYRDLATCRPSEGPIPWSAASLYAQVKGLDADNAELLWSIVRAMDQAEREWMVANPLAHGEVIKADA